MNAEILNNLAGKVQDFSVALMDQVTPTEEKSIVNNASLLDSITQPAIDYQQKKVSEVPVIIVCYHYPRCDFYCYCIRQSM